MKRREKCNEIENVRGESNTLKILYYFFAFFEKIHRVKNR